MDHHLSDTLLLIGLVLALLWVFAVKKRKQCRLPPGPRALPLVGNLHQLDKQAPFNSLAKLSETYGPVMTVYLGPKRAVFLVGYDAVKEALVEQANDFAGRGAPPFFTRVTRGYGVLISNGDRHRQLRRFTLSTLKDFGMGRKGMEQWIQEEGRHLAARIEDTEGAPFDPTSLLSCAMSNVICCLVFGQRFAYDNAHFLRLLTIVNDTFTFFSSPLAQLYNVFPWLMERVPGRHHDCFADIEELREFIVERIKEHKETMDPDSPRDYIDCFLHRVDQEKELRTSEFHEDNLVATVLNLFQAGTEPTSATLRFTLSVLIKYPNIQEQMQQEIDNVIGRGRCPNMGDRKSLPFTDSVIHEIQRFLDIVPMSIPHYALHDVSFRGYSIPKGTLIIPMLHTVLRDKGRWATPWSFNPQHFLDHNGNFKKNPAFLPFSAGKRACVGESLARTMLFLFIASLLQRFSFSCSAGPDSIDLSPEFSSFANVPRKYHVIATPR